MNTMRRLWLLLTFALVLVGCADPAEYASFHASGFEDLPDCLVDSFPVEPDFRAIRRRTDNVGIFLQTASDIKSRNDVVYFEIYEPDSLQAQTPLVLGSIHDTAAPARGKLVFSSSCPFYRQSLEIQGALIFDSFDLNHGGIVAGRLEDGSVIDPRTGTSVIDELHGSWRFIVRKGPPYEDFYALPERPEPGQF